MTTRQVSLRMPHRLIDKIENNKSEYESFSEAVRKAIQRGMDQRKYRK